MRFGIGWRPQIGSGIVANLDRIEVVEVLAEELFHAGAEQKRAMRFLRAQVPVVLHATSLGLASAERVDRRRLDAVARVIDWLEPEFWSEHLAFVRAGGAEIGHLAAPPRNDATLEGLLCNLAEVRSVAGRLPLLENVATLVDPPLSTYDEGAWLPRVLDVAGCELLLDLHNLHANATNFGFDAAEVVLALPQDRIGAVHLAGGRRIERDLLLDDHLHEVPDPVYELLSLLHCDATVILERDGNYPAFSELLCELDRARAVRPDDRRRRPSPLPTPDRRETPTLTGIEPLLARLYTDDSLREQFQREPGHFPRELDSLRGPNLDLAAHSFARKRAIREAKQ
jgi:uncharacterized protein (UPF0276 family)